MDRCLHRALPCAVGERNRSGCRFWASRWYVPSASCSPGVRRGASTGDSKRVFISYNHEDAAIARRLRDALAASGLDVSLDVDSMAPGERIQDFIERSIRDSDAVISIVSTDSLLSSWVAIETINAFHRQKWADRKLFVGALLSDDFFRPEFRLECTRSHR